MFGGRKDKKPKSGDRKRDKSSSTNNDLAGMFGLNMPTPDDSELEAELLAMTGGASGRGSSGNKVPLSAADIDKMVSAIGDDDDDDLSDLSDLDDDQLLGELQAMEYDSPPPPEPSPPPRQSTGSDPPRSSTGSDPPPRSSTGSDPPSTGSVGVVNARLEMYQRAISEADRMGESSKAKRYKRGLSTLNQLLKSAKVGKQITEDDLPPAIVIKPPPSKTTPTKPAANLINLDDPESDEFNINDDELVAMDTKPHPQPSQSHPPKPRQTAPPPPRQAPPPVKADGRIDLNDPQFDEFNLSEEELAAMADMLVDDRKKPKLDNDPVKPVKHVEPSHSLPARIPPSVSSDKDSVRGLLSERKDQYLIASKANKSKLKEYRIMAAQFGRVLKALDDDQVVDLSQMPGPPPGYKSSYNIDISNLTLPSKPLPQPSPVESPDSSLTSEPDQVDPEIPVPKTTMEALQQRLIRYKETVKTAQENGESSRIRRLGRIVKSYEDAIKSTKSGKPYDYNELPVPPGYPPIPAPRMGVATRSVVPPTQSLPVSKPVARQPVSLNMDQLRLIETRRAELQKAARNEQSKGNKDKALEYLKLRKGVDLMFEAARGGVRINPEEIPPSPFADLAQTQPSKAVLGHLKPANENDGETFDLIEKQLLKQIEICTTNSETYRKMGSTPTSLQYQNMSQNCQRELLAIKAIRSQNLGPPKFTIETRKFTVVNSNAELSSSVCEVHVIRGLNVPKPSGYEDKDMAVYVEAEFPWPPDQPAKDSTIVVKNTCHPEFPEQRLKFEIDRKKIKTMTRAFKRSPVKCAMWQKRSLRKDLFIGQVQLAIDGLETHSQVTGVVDLTDERGRKQVGGKLELAISLREPLAGPDKEEREEQWLVFQESIADKSPVVMPKPTVGGGASKTTTTPNYALLSPVKVDNMISLEALKLEFNLVQVAMKGGHRDKATSSRGKMIHDRQEAIKAKLSSDVRFRQSYSRNVTKEMNEEQQLEAQLQKQGKSKQAEVLILQKRRGAMEKEIKALGARKL